jgi:hypothetical protein
MRRATMTCHWHPVLQRIVRWLKPSAENFAAAAAVYGPDLMLELARRTQPRRRCREVQ